MSGYPLILPKPQFSDLNGNPLSGGTLQSFIDGGVTPEPLYSDGAATIPAGTSFTLNSRGEPTTPLFARHNKVYQFVLKDALGVTVYTVPGYRVDPPVRYQQTAAELAAGVTPTNFTYEPYKAPPRYGAFGDATTDDAAAIQRQINSCIAAGSELDLWGTVATGYKINTPLAITGKLKIVGDGYGKCGIIANGCNAFNISASNTQVEFHGFRINSAIRHSTTPNTLKGINIQGTTGNYCEYHTYSDLFIDGFQTAVQANAVLSSTFDNIHTVFGENGIVAEQKTVNNRVVNCQLTGSAGKGIQIGDGTAASEGWVIANSIIFGFGRGVWGFGSNNSKVIGCIIDFFTEYGVILQSGAAIAATNWVIAKNYMAATGGVASTGVRCLSSFASSDPRGNRIIANDILKYSGSTLTHGILVDGTQEIYNRIIGNNCSANTYACRVQTGSAHVVSANAWVAGGFTADVMTTYEGNQGTNSTPLMTRQTNGANHIYHVTGAAPASGAFLRGDIAWETAPAAAGVPGYMCVTAGSPGTWKAMAVLAA